MPAVFDFEHQVTADEIDDLGHVNNIQYLRWLLNAAIAHAEEQGWSLRRHRDIGAGWVVRSHYIEYLRPALAGDRVIVRTWVADFRKTTSMRKYRVLRASDRERLVVAETNWVFIGYERGLPRRIPAEVSSSFEVVNGEPDEWLTTGG